MRWDALYYMTIAARGYPEPRPGWPIHQLAFFPLYPLAVRAMAPLFGGNLFWSAFAVSNLCTLLAALLMLKLGALRRRTDGVRAALLFLASPGAHFFAYPYSEALFALGLALGFVALRDGRLALAAGAGAAASATRSPGVAVALALRSLARRIEAATTEADELEREIASTCAPSRRSCWTSPASARSSPRS